nr:hypothetical protein BaRGS_009343 [Batillaria attramentaria]
MFAQKGAPSTGFNVFVTSLSLADFLMGVYLAMVGAADSVYRGKYLWSDNVWKTSAACKTAGFLSLLSSEVSALMICLITLDRFLVLRFPFSRFHFRGRSALVACGIAWAVGLILAAVPLLPVTSAWEFYSQSGICIPLPITRKSFGGRDYAFAVMIVVNLILFLLIAAGQASIYWSIRANSMSKKTSRKSKEMVVARRLTSIVVSDFLCWFPIGVLGMMASAGTPVPSEVNVSMAIFVLPLNSALNPFLYTFNVLMERRRKAEEDRILKDLEMLAVAEKINLGTCTVKTSHSEKV